MGFFDKIAEGIKKTRDSMMSKVNSLINSFTKIDEDFFEELEETLIMCDIGVQTSVDICAELRKKVKEKGITDPMLIKDELKAIITEMLGEDKKLDLFALICELCRQLSYGGGLARTVYADNKHYRRLCGKVKLLVLAKHFGDDGFQLVFYEHRVGDALFLDLFSQLGTDIHRSLHADIAQ